jgi:hypothetical protein
MACEVAEVVVYLMWLGGLLLCELTSDVVGDLFV